MSEHINSKYFLPEKLQDGDLSVKVSACLDYIIDKALKDFEDVKYKYRGPDIVREETIKEIIKELGFQYISDVMDTISNFQFNVLLEFVSLVNLLKGSREGLELILKLLGFDSIITEWWQQAPPAEPDTFVITVIMDTSLVADPVKTIWKVQEFARQYVFPMISHIDYRFALTFAEKNATVAGFSKSTYRGEFVVRI